MPILLNCSGMKQTKSLKFIVALYELNLAFFLLLHGSVSACLNSFQGRKRGGFMGKKKKIPPIITLSYKKGDLIFKQGDYGISMYKIIEGKVLVFKESGDREVILASLGQGEIIGEMTFLSGPNVPRNASAKAVVDSAPAPIKENVTKDEAEALKNTIIAADSMPIKTLLKLHRIFLLLF